ncbi:MAG: hypothetical protein KDK70_04195 [Myxococcales bacterium]|nr:hypothetical protein [Myxococcales bacterium]
MSRLAPGAPALAMLMACGSLVSLDPPEPSSSGSTATGSSGTSTSTSADGSTTVTPADSTTAATPDLPPPGSCPQGCALELNQVWSWDAEPLPADPLPVERSISAIVRTLDDEFVIADHRDGQPWISRVTNDGVELWSIPADLSCDCRITSLAITDDGQLLVGAEGTFFGRTNVFAIARYDLFLPSLEWLTWDILYQFTEHPPRVGSIVTIDDAFVGLLVVEADIFGDPTTHETLELLLFQERSFWSRFPIDSQPYSEVAWRPLGRTTPNGGLVVGLTDTSGSQDDGYLVWLGPGGAAPIAVEPLPSPPEAMDLGAGWTTFVAGHERSSPREVSLHVSRTLSVLPLDWTHTESIPTTSDRTPALVADCEGGAIAALRVTTGPTEPPALALVRVADDGSLSGSTTLPIPADAAAQPVFLALDSKDDLMIATLVEGELHLEKHSRGCQCD